MKAMVEEATDRNKRSIRKNIDEYLALRRYTGAIKPSFDLLLLPLEIPERVLQDPRVKELEMLAIDMIAVANDVVSFNVEQARGDIHNIVIVLINESGYGVQQAMDYVGQWYQGHIDRFLHIANQPPETGDKQIDGNLKKYVWGLGYWITANYEWSFRSKRFFGTDHVQKGAVVQLLPRRTSAN